MQTTSSLKLINASFSLTKALNPVEIFRGLWANRRLFGSLVKDSISAKFRHSRLGILWLVIPNLTTLAIYTYIFSCVFQMKWPGQTIDSKLLFGLSVYAGITSFSTFSDTIMGSCSAVSAKVNYVKKIPVSLVLFPLAVSVSNFIVSGTALLIMTMISSIVFQEIGTELLLFIPVLLPLLLLAGGVSMISAALGVFFKDIGNLLGILIQILFFTAPVFYSLDSIPSDFRFISYFNPMTPAIINIRNVLINHLPADWELLIYSWLWGIFMFHLGYLVFSFLRRRFADAL